MTTDQHPGGVAGRKLDEIAQEMHAEPLGSEHRLHYAFELGGAEDMHKVISREARTILAEWEQRMENEMDWGSVAGYSMTEAYPVFNALQWEFQRLGLDLESEDE